MIAVLPLRGVWRAQLIDTRVHEALVAIGVEDLVELATWTRRELLGVPNLGPAAVAKLERLLARYELALAADKPRRFREPR
jgi:DNA-directed RNA polymerase alpha subunit